MRDPRPRVEPWAAAAACKAAPVAPSRQPVFYPPAFPAAHGRCPVPFGHAVTVVQHHLSEPSKAEHTLNCGQESEGCLAQGHYGAGGGAHHPPFSLPLLWAPPAIVRFFCLFYNI